VKQIITFYSDEKMYGVDIKLVNDINPNVDIMPVPLSDDFIRGLVNIRGQVVMIYDIGVVFAEKKSVINSASHLIILKTAPNLLRCAEGDDYSEVINILEDKPVGILVDMIGDVISVEESQLDTSTDIINRKEWKCIKGVYKVNHQVIAVLDVPAVLSYKGTIPVNG